MSERRHRLVDCNPRWGLGTNGVQRISFDCPEGHEGCRYSIPVVAGAETEAGWGCTGQTFDTLSITPSVRGVPKFASRDEAERGVDRPDLVHPRMWCACRVVITAGVINFQPDSK